MKAGISLKYQLNLVRVMDYWGSGDESLISELLRRRKPDMVDRYVVPFRRELDLNLLSLETTNGKRDLIKYYIFEFAELQGFFKEYEDLLKSRFKRKLSKFELYAIDCFDLFNIAMNEIQLCCFKFKIDFRELCKELRFEIKYFDLSMTMLADEVFQISRARMGFENLLKGNGKKIYRYLVNNYKNTKPIAIAFMVFALIELELIDGVLLSYQTKLYRLLSESFGPIGTRQNLNINIKKLRTPDSYQKDQIQVHKKEIQAQLTKK